MKRILLLALMVALSLALPACSSDGQISFLGYQSGNLFDTKYKTVQVNIFQNRTLYRGLEFELAKDIVTQIESISPMKVVDCNADLILNGKILTVVKQDNLQNPNNAGRVIAFTMTAEVILTDGRTGELLSKPPPRPLSQPAADLIPLINDRPDIPGLMNQPTPHRGSGAFVNDQSSHNDASDGNGPGNIGPDHEFALTADPAKWPGDAAYLGAKGSDRQVPERVRSRTWAKHSDGSAKA